MIVRLTIQQDGVGFRAMISKRDDQGNGTIGRQALFPVLAFGAPQGGAASFPTLFSTASGVCGLVAGPSSASRRLDFE